MPDMPSSKAFSLLQPSVSARDEQKFSALPFSRRSISVGKVIISIITIPITPTLFRRRETPAASVLRVSPTDEPTTGKLELVMNFTARKETESRADAIRLCDASIAQKTDITRVIRFV